MNATKRKFNALLNGIGNKSSTSLSSREVNNASQTDLASTTDPSSTKKRRTSDSNSISNENAFSSKSRLSTRPSAMPHKKSASLATASQNTEPPKYAPYDRKEFLKRLKSFSNLTDWTPKPARVNEVEWAKRGWICQKFERVRCSLCNVEILVKLNKKEVDGKEQDVFVAQNIEDALVDKYVELIVSAHDENCLWRGKGCDSVIFRLPLNQGQTAFEPLRERYDELCSRSENLPYIFNLRTPPEFDLDLTLSHLPSNFFVSTSENTPAPEVNKVALIMALFGWQDHTYGRLGVQPGSVSCHACFRVLGLWIFKSKEVNAAGEEMASPVVNCLDVVKEHRDYCPWRNAASQNGLKASEDSGSNALAGWQMMLRVLKNEHYLQHRNEIRPEKVSKPATSDAVSDIDSVLDDEEEMKIRDEKDKQRWARLRRVKSMFDTKGGKKVKRTESQEKPAT